MLDRMPPLLRTAVRDPSTLRLLIAVLAPAVASGRAIADTIWYYTPSNLPANSFKTLGEAESSMRAVPPDPNNLRRTLYSELVFQANGVSPSAVQRWYGVLPRAASGFYPWTYWEGSFVGSRQASEEAALQSAIDYLQRVERLCAVVATDSLPRYSQWRLCSESSVGPAPADAVACQYAPQYKVYKIEYLRRTFDNKTNARFHPKDG